VCGPDRWLVDAYEEMRDWIGEERTERAGYQLLRRQGMAAWIEAFSGCLGSGAGGRAFPLAAGPAPSCRASMPRVAGDSLKVPEALYPELTGLLAGLALGLLEEGVC
jgi:hypothetical protein